jgi:hypothetical protein
MSTEFPRTVKRRGIKKIIPFLAELSEAPTLRCCERPDPQRPRLEQLVYEVFKQVYNAELRNFRDYLLRLEQGGDVLGVAGSGYWAVARVCT